MKTNLRKIINGKANSISGYRTLKGLICLMFLIVGFGLHAIAMNPQHPLDSIYHVVEKQPAFKGKPADIQKFIKMHLVYPQDAWMQGVEGIVQVSFVVSRHGQVLNSKVEKSLGAELDMEALRLVDLMQNWKPGVVNGEPVNTFVSLPVIFKLNPDERELVNTLRKYGLSENPPMYVIDDKIVNTRIHLPAYNLKSIRVLKGDQAVEKYGEKARKGVVIITTKRGTPPVR